MVELSTKILGSEEKATTTNITFTFPPPTRPLPPALYPAPSC